MHRYILVFAFFHFSAACPAQQDDRMWDTVTTVTTAAPVEAANDYRFSDTATRQPLQLKKVPQEKVEALKKDDNYWYANLEPEKKNEEAIQPKNRRKGLLDQSWFLNLLWIIILCSFIGAVVWYLVSSNVGLFRRESKKIIEEETAEELPEDIFTINYEKEIQKAVDARNYRLAVRLWYLRTLKELSSRNIINYRHEKTNNDYVNSLFGGRFYRDFFRLTRNFEYTWYGQFDLSEQAYELMRKDFVNFKNSLA